MTTINDNHLIFKLKNGCDVDLIGENINKKKRRNEMYIIMSTLFYFLYLI